MNRHVDFLASSLVRSIARRGRGPLCAAGVALATFACAQGPALLSAEEAQLGKIVAKDVSRTLPLDTLRHGSTSDQHPLDGVLAFARERQVFLDETVRDFTCRLIKRERIDGFLQDYQYIDMRVRESVRRDEKLHSPLSISLSFVAPPSVAGRRVIFVEGQNDGKMLVRNGGKHFDYVVVRVDPNSDVARDESLVPITESGFKNILGHMIKVLEQHSKIDPTGENTHVRTIKGAKVDKRLCTVTRIEHPTKESGLQFHQASVFIDDELGVPVRVEFSDWPRREGQPAPLLAEYTYTDLKLNVQLPDSEFRAANLKGKGIIRRAVEQTVGP